MLHNPTIANKFPLPTLNTPKTYINLINILNTPLVTQSFTFTQFPWHTHVLDWRANILTSPNQSPNHHTPLAHIDFAAARRAELTLRRYYHLFINQLVIYYQSIIIYYQSSLDITLSQPPNQSSPSPSPSPSPSQPSILPLADIQAHIIASSKQYTNEAILKKFFPQFLHDFSQFYNHFLHSCQHCNQKIFLRSVLPSNYITPWQSELFSYIIRHLQQTIIPHIVAISHISSLHHKHQYKADIKIYWQRKNVAEITHFAAIRQHQRQLVANFFKEHPL